MMYDFLMYDLFTGSWVSWHHQRVIKIPGKVLCAASGLADFRHPDVTLESGLVPHTIGDILLR